MATIYRRSILMLVALILVSPVLVVGPIQAQGVPTTYTFPETGKTVRGRFLQYWQERGSLAQFGYPITDEIGEMSPVTNRLYTVQYFERAVFELHPENQPPNDVLLTLLGVFAFQKNYPWGAAEQVSNTSPGSRSFPETGKRVGGAFLAYWNEHGGLAQQGYPITDELIEVNSLNGKPYLVQYFERAVFEYHPENPTATRVLLAQLGTARYKQVYEGSSPRFGPPVPMPPAIVTPTPVPFRGNPTSTARPPSAPPPTPTRANSAGGGGGGGGGGVCGTPYSPSGPDRDCGDFATQAQAQCLFRAAGGPARDPHRLDADNDGIACESLP